ncbi:MAG: hypothetical protein PHI88_02325 [Candidatus Pacebacteria bacterium]|nr:hypothetical protein [Candidatus Paceibacterota bacterium]
MNQKPIIFLVLFLISIIFLIFFYFLNKEKRESENFINNTTPTINVPEFTPTIETGPTESR